MLDRDHNPQLPEGETPFVADDVLYSGNFVKIALNVAHRVGQPDNVLADLLWSWFGASAGRVMAGGRPSPAWRALSDYDRPERFC